MQLYFIRHGQSTNNALYARTGASQGRSEDPELTATGKKQALHLAIYLSDPANFERSSLTWRVEELQRSLRGSKGPALPAVGGLTHLYSSLMVRSLATGSLVSESTGLALVGWVDLHEGGGIYLDEDQLNDAGPGGEPRSPGTLPFDPESAPGPDGRKRVGLAGKPRAYFIEAYPHLLLPDEVSEQGWWNRPYESPAARADRAERVLKELLRRHGALRPDGSEDRVAFISHGGFYNHFMRQVLQMPGSAEEDEIDDVWFEFNNVAITRLDYLDDRFLVVYQNRTSFLPHDLVT